MFDMSDDDSDISVNELKAKLVAQQKQTDNDLLEMEASRKAAKLRERLGQYENYGGQQVAVIPSHEYIKTQHNTTPQLKSNAQIMQSNSILSHTIQTSQEQLNQNHDNSDSSEESPDEEYKVVDSVPLNSEKRVQEEPIIVGGGSYNMNPDDPNNQFTKDQFDAIMKLI